MLIQAEVSLYAMGEVDLVPAVYEFVRRLERDGLDVEPGPMSTLVAGESGLVFEAVREAYEDAARGGRRALVIKIMNMATK